MIRTKTPILVEIKKLKKQKKKLQMEYLQLHQISMLDNTGKLIQKELNELTGKIDGLSWVAYTNLPKTKTKKK